MMQAGKLWEIVSRKCFRWDWSKRLIWLSAFLSTRKLFLLLLRVTFRRWLESCFERCWSTRSSMEPGRSSGRFACRTGTCWPSPSWSCRSCFCSPGSTASPPRCSPRPSSRSSARRRTSWCTLPDPSRTASGHLSMWPWLCRWARRWLRGRTSCRRRCWEHFGVFLSVLAAETRTSSPDPLACAWWGSTSMRQFDDICGSDRRAVPASPASGPDRATKGWRTTMAESSRFSLAPRRAWGGRFCSSCSAGRSCNPSCGTASAAAQTRGWAGPKFVLTLLYK